MEILKDTTIYALQSGSGDVVETGTAREVTVAWLKYDGGDFYIEPRMIQDTNEDTGEDFERQETVGDEKVWDIYIKNSANCRFVKAHFGAYGETEDDAVNYMLNGLWQDGITRDRKFSVITKAHYDEIQAERAAEANDE